MKRFALLTEKSGISRKVIRYCILFSMIDILVCGASIFAVGYAINIKRDKPFLESYSIIAVLILIIVLGEIIWTARLAAKEAAVGHLPENENAASSIKLLFSEFISRTETLTPTERLIFNSYLENRTGKEAAELLGITANTLKVHNNHIYKKLMVSSKEELSLYIELIRKSGMISEILKQDETNVS
jgi:DNA-binding CsgD family transcriptional regulator